MGSAAAERTEVRFRARKETIVYPAAAAAVEERREEEVKVSDRVLWGKKLTQREAVSPVEGS